MAEPTNRNKYKTRRQVELWNDDVEWFKRSHGGASLSWIMSLLLHSYREKVENIGPLYNSLEAAASLKEEIDQGLHTNQETLDE